MFRRIPGLDPDFMRNVPLLQTGKGGDRPDYVPARADVDELIRQARARWRGSEEIALFFGKGHCGKPSRKLPSKAKRKAYYDEWPVPTRKISGRLL